MYKRRDFEGFFCDIRKNNTNNGQYVDYTQVDVDVIESELERIYKMLNEFDYRSDLEDTADLGFLDLRDLIGLALKLF